MKSKYLLGGLFALGALAAPIAVQAQQFTTISQVLGVCPDLDQARDCPPAASGFLGTGPRSDVEISTLALTLAQAGQFPRVPMPVCLNTADGIRVLARGANTAATARQLNDIADSLCLGGGTAAIPAATPPEPAVSLASEGSDEDTSPSNGGDTNGGDTNGGDTNGGDTNGGDGNGGHGNGGHGNGGHGNGGHGNGGHGNGGHGNGGHGNGGHGNGGHGNGGHGNGGHGNGGHGNGGHGNGGHDKD